jgi:hypothetical protein
MFDDEIAEVTSRDFVEKYRCKSLPSPATTTHSNLAAPRERVRTAAALFFFFIFFLPYRVQSTYLKVN